MAIIRVVFDFPVELIKHLSVKPGFFSIWVFVILGVFQVLGGNGGEFEGFDLGFKGIDKGEEFDLGEWVWGLIEPVFPKWVKVYGRHCID